MPDRSSRTRPPTDADRAIRLVETRLQRLETAMASVREGVVLSPVRADRGGRLPAWLFACGVVMILTAILVAVL